MNKRFISKLELRRIRDTKRGDRGDHTTRGACQSPIIEVNSEFQAEDLSDYYLDGKNHDDYCMKMQENIGDTGYPIKQLIAKKHEDAAMKKIALARMMLQGNPEYGIRLSENHLRKIEAKMLRDVQPLDINKRRMLYQMYTFKRVSEEDKKNMVKEGLVQPDTTGSKKEEPFANKSIQDFLSCDKTSECVQTDKLSSYSANTDIAIVPSHVPDEIEKETLQGNQTDISNTPPQGIQPETANVPSQRILVETAKQTGKKNQADKLSLPAQKLPVDVKKHPSQKKQDVDNQPSQKKQTETAIEPSQRLPDEMAKGTLQRNQTGILSPPRQKLFGVRKYTSQKKQGDVGSQLPQKTSVNMAKEPSQKKQTETAIGLSQRIPVETGKETRQRNQANISNTMSQKVPVDMAMPSQNKQSEIANVPSQQSIDVAKETWLRKHAPIGNRIVMQANITPNFSHIKEADPTSQIHAVNQSLQKQVNLPHPPLRKRYTRMPQELSSQKKRNDIAYSPSPTNYTDTHTRPKKQIDKHLHEEKKHIDSRQHSPVAKNRAVKSQSPPEIAPANNKRKPIIKTLTITQKGHATKIYKAVSFVEEKKALKVNMDHKPERSMTASSLRSLKSKQLSTSSPEGTSVSLNSRKRAEKDDSPSPNEMENSPSSIAKLVMNRRRKFKSRKRRAKSPEMQEPLPLPQTEVAKWAPQSVNEHTKPYYEAWVNTTLTAVSSDSENVRREKERILQMMRERLENCLCLSEEELSDEMHTGRIKVVSHR